MSIIRVLPEHVANQIAAGEVVERPVAVVKELVENSLDAGARRVEVEYRHGGKSWIRVEDDGCGMSPEDAALSLKRHATSKLRETDDLQKILSFGFRGEAIPSVASVSRFTLRTREKDSSNGCEILVNAGQWVHQQDCGMPVGTRIEVAHLFHAVPVRRKFLKTDNTEASHIQHVMRLFAVAHPGVAFHLLENGRTQMQVHATASRRERIAKVWGSALAQDLLALPDLEDAASGLRLRGFISKPKVLRATRQEIVCMVNNRPVDNKALQYALTEAYHTYIPKGKYPAAFLFLDIPPEAVDVNVHPAKREIRFRDEALIRQLLIPHFLACLQEATAVQKGQGLVAEEEAVVYVSKTLLPAPRKRLPESLAVEGVAVGQSPQRIPVPVISPRGRANSSSATSVSTNSAPPFSPEVAVEKSGVIPPVKFNRDWHFLSFYAKEYVLWAAPQGLVCMSWVAAQSRVAYESILDEFAKSQPTSQELLIPLTIELEPRLATIASSSVAFFAAHGIGLSDFGGHAWRVDRLPLWLAESQAEALLREIWCLMRDEGLRLGDNSLLFERLARMAVLKGRQQDRLTQPKDAQELLGQLFACSNPYADAQGYATFFELSDRDLQKRLGRV